MMGRSGKCANTNIIINVYNMKIHVSDRYDDLITTTIMVASSLFRHIYSTIVFYCTFLRQHVFMHDLVKAKFMQSE